MQMRALPKTPGKAGWVRSRTPYETPAELPHGSKITVLAHQGQTVSVRDASGREWSLLHWQVDCGWEFTRRGKLWLPESDPRVLALLKDRVAKLAAKTPDPATENDRMATIEMLEEILRRNGVSPH